jgi:SLBB domain
MDKKENLSSPRLPFYERITACILFFFILFLVGLNLYLDEGQSSPLSSAEPHYLVKPYIEVTVKGAVARPGVYQVARGTLVGEVIQMAHPLNSADLGTIKRDSIITRKRTINIKETSKKKSYRLYFHA